MLVSEHKEVFYVLFVCRMSPHQRCLEHLGGIQIIIQKTLIQRVDDMSIFPVLCAGS